MTEIEFCKRCLYTTSHPLGLILDKNGICSGCRVHEEKNFLDWDLRWHKLLDLVEPYRNVTGNNYDCIVPVTGGQDSFYVVHLVKNQLRLNPLLVSYNKYFNTISGIRNLANLRMIFNCDIISQNINPTSVKKITRTTLRRLGSIYWPILAGQTVFPVQSAVRFNIPLIIWGAHQGLEQVGMFSHEHEVEMTRRYRKDHDLMGYEADDLLSVFDTLSEQDIWQYRYPEDCDLNSVGVRGIYLGNYVRWDPKSQHEMMIRDYGYCTSRFPRTFDCYDYVDCYNYMGIHDLLKLYKHGYSKVTDHVCREIRHNRITREEGIMLVRAYETKCTGNTQEFCKWLGITSNALQFLMNRHRNPRFWQEYSPNNWKFNGLSTKLELSDIPLSDVILTKLGFIVTDANRIRGSSGYVTVGKGYP